MAVAAWWFALSPNLLAHGTLVTMELPIVAAMTATTFLFWVFLRTGDRRVFFASAACAGLAWSCKYTAVLIPPIFGNPLAATALARRTARSSPHRHSGCWRIGQCSSR